MKISKSFIIFGATGLPENTLECHQSVAEVDSEKRKKVAD
jgi:hypothetical protein